MAGVGPLHEMRFDLASDADRDHPARNVRGVDAVVVSSAIRNLGLSMQQIDDVAEVGGERLLDLRREQVLGLVVDPDLLHQPDGLLGLGIVRREGTVEGGRKNRVDAHGVGVHIRHFAQPARVRGKVARDRRRILAWLCRSEVGADEVDVFPRAAFACWK